MLERLAWPRENERRLAWPQLHEGYPIVNVRLISPSEKTKFTTPPLQSPDRNHNIVILCQDRKDLFVIKPNLEVTFD